MKKSSAVLMLILTILIVGGIGFLGFKYYKCYKENLLYIQTVNTLQGQLDAIGPIGTAYTVKTNVTVGDEITADNIVSMSIPEACMTENYVRSASDITGKYFKVSMQMGTPLTVDEVMAQELEGALYVRELTLDYAPIGVKVGDYIDLRIDLPWGETFIVLQHLRVMGMVDTTVQVWLDEASLALYKSALTDKSFYGDKGVNLYAIKYVEPGLHEDVQAFYPVRQEVAGVVSLNSNIKNKNKCINTKLRSDIDTRLNQVKQEDGGKLAAGVAKESGNIKTTDDFLRDNVETAAPSTELSNSGIGAADAYDAEGNTSKITGSMEAANEGANQFTDIDLIQ